MQHILTFQYICPCPSHFLSLAQLKQGVFHGHYLLELIVQYHSND